MTTAMRGPVLELLERVNGDAVAFAAQLADVKRLQERKAEQLLQHLRETGESRGFNAAFTKQDRSRFLEALEQAVQRTKRSG